MRKEFFSTIFLLERFLPLKGPVVLEDQSEFHRDMEKQELVDQQLVRALILQ